MEIPVLLFLFLAVVAGLLFLLLTIHLYAKYTCGRFHKPTRMDGKTVVVTGCTSGIGKETARDLANRGARVIMACRNLEDAEKVKEDIIETTKNENVVVKKLDLSSFASIREFAKDLNKKEKRLDVLIHNAGYCEMFKKKISADNTEVTMQTNHYGPFLLTHLLIDLLKKSLPSRIVIVASSFYRITTFNLNDPNPVNSIPVFLYFASKEANVLITQEFSRRLEGSGVTVNSLHPGLIRTGICRSVPVPLSWGLAFINTCFFKTAQEGCQTTVMLAVDEDLGNVSGKYFSDCRESTLSRTASDMEKARKLWEISEKIVKLGDGDPSI